MRAASGRYGRSEAEQSPRHPHREKAPSDGSDPGGKPGSTDAWQLRRLGDAVWLFVATLPPQTTVQACLLIRRTSANGEDNETDRAADAEDDQQSLPSGAGETDQDE